MLIPAYFHDAGVPKTGLSPTIDIYRASDNSLVVNDGAMTSVGGGFYKYDFAAYDASEDYLYVCDGTATLANAYRYLSGSTNSHAKDALVLNNLDHLMKVAVADDDDLTAEVADDTVLSLLMTQEGDTSTYFPGGCSLLGIYATFGSGMYYLQIAIGDAGEGLTAIPWNAAWDAEVQSEVTDALNAYDPPTKAELDTGLDALPTAAEIKTAIEAGGGHLALILEDTGTTLPTAVADLPTNAELASALAAADDAVLAAIAALNNLGSAEAQAAAEAALIAYGAALQTSVDDLETHATNMLAVLDRAEKALINKLIITEADGTAEMFDNSNVSLGTVPAAFSSDGTYTTRKRMVPT